jgi:hypothetical protein
VLQIACDGKLGVGAGPDGAAVFQDIMDQAAATRQDCPVSRVLAGADIVLNARLAAH